MVSNLDGRPFSVFQVSDIQCKLAELHVLQPVVSEFCVFSTRKLNNQDPESEFRITLRLQRNTVVAEVCVFIANVLQTYRSGSVIRICRVTLLLRVSIKKCRKSTSFWRLMLVILYASTAAEENSRCYSLNHAKHHIFSSHRVAVSLSTRFEPCFF